MLKIDIDHFRAFHDTYGHPFAEQLLWRVSQVITKTLRTTDVSAPQRTR